MTRRKTREGSVNVEQLTARARTLSAHNTQSNLIDEVTTTQSRRIVSTMECFKAWEFRCGSRRPERGLRD